MNKIGFYLWYKNICNIQWNYDKYIYLFIWEKDIKVVEFVSLYF